jgi:Domain of unknown function (DUF4214)
MMPPRQWDPRADQAQLIAEWYARFLRRQPEPQAFQQWMGTMNRTSPDVALASILGSEEYYRLWGATDAGFVSALYADILGRQCNQQEVYNWLQNLSMHGDRARLAHEFMTAAQAELQQRGMM